MNKITSHGSQGFNVIGMNKSRMAFAHGDISVIGLSGGARPFRIAASATRYYAGEPMMRTPTYTAGVLTTNTITVVTDAKPRVATDDFIGIATKDAPTTPTTLAAHTTSVMVPIAHITKMRGRAKTAANVDTDAELLGVLGDLVDFDLTAGAYTIDDVAASNASALQIVDGNIAKQTLDVIIDARGLRTVIS